MSRLRRAFTLVELLVVIAIIILLMALLLPAIQKVRESANRMICGNNLKQLGIACHHYHNDYKYFPRGKGKPYAGAAGYARWSAHALLLPYIEQDALYKSIDFNFSPSTPGMAGVVNFMPPWQNPGMQNDLQSRTYISMFICPSDDPPESIDGWPGKNNYVASEGAQFLCDLGPGFQSTLVPNATPNGIFLFGGNVKIAEIFDGTSNTAIFSEKIRGHGTPKPRSDMFIMPNQTTLDGTCNTCQALNPKTATPLTSKQGYSWVMGEMCCTLYNHVSKPNTLTCAGLPFPGNMANMAMDVPPSSYHPAGVNVLFGDGGVHFVTNDVDLQIWRALGTRNGAEQVSVDF